jgi:UDP-glucuronate 4-epimerase
VDQKCDVLITGCAGFIGFHLSRRMLEEGYNVVGVDNLNKYYDPSLKKDRLAHLLENPRFKFVKGSLENKELLELLFDQYHFEIVVNLAAQAGVRYSLEHPETYIQSNIVGFCHLLECCRKHPIKHLLYASSSSVYGDNQKVPFSIKDRVDHPISIYAATKKANEEMAYTYSHLYKLPTTGLRFFTVYGPWGRPDMAIFSFSNAIIENRPIEIFNYGKMKRDFTYIDDVIEAIYRLIEKGPLEDDTIVPHTIYNIGNHHPTQLQDFVELLEEGLGKKAIKKYVPLQPGEVTETFADIEDLVSWINYMPSTSVEDGVKKFVEWYKDYYNLS